MGPSDGMPRSVPPSGFPERYSSGNRVIQNQQPRQLSRASSNQSVSSSGSDSPLIGMNSPQILPEHYDMLRNYHAVSQMFQNPAAQSYDTIAASPIAQRARPQPVISELLRSQRTGSQPQNELAHSENQALSLSPPNGLQNGESPYNSTRDGNNVNQTESSPNGQTVNFITPEQHMQNRSQHNGNLHYPTEAPGAYPSPQPHFEGRRTSQPQQDVNASPVSSPNADLNQARADLRRIQDIVMHKETLVPHLNQILKVEGMGVTGLKRHKQDMLLKRAQMLLGKGLFSNLQEMRASCENIIAQRRYGSSGNVLSSAPPPTYSGQIHNQLSASPFSDTAMTGSQNGSTRSRAPPVMPPEFHFRNLTTSQLRNQRNQIFGQARTQSSSQPPQIMPHYLEFQKSPFYKLGTIVHKPIFLLTPHRSRILQQSLTFSFPPDAQLNEGTSVVLVSQEYKKNEQGPQPMYFPFYFETEVDGKTFKCNTRGVRGTVGSAKPVDLKKAVITQVTNSGGDSEMVRRALAKRHSLRFMVNINDTGEVSSSKSFGLMLCTANFVPIGTLIESIKTRPHIPVEKTKKMAAELADDDVVADDAVYSLKDTVMMTRISTPIRSTVCTHIDCFDAESFMMLQSQAETWKCPVCNKSISWESLAVDDFFLEILKVAGPTISSVAIKADGSWSVCAESDDEMTSSEEDVPMPKRQREEIVEILSDDEEDGTERNNQQNSGTNPTPSRRENGPLNPLSAHQPQPQPQPQPQSQSSHPVMQSLGSSSRSNSNSHLSQSSHEQHNNNSTSFANQTPDAEFNAASNALRRSRNMVFDDESEDDNVVDLTSD